MKVTRTTINNNSIAFHNGLFNSDGTHISQNVNAFYLYGVGRSTLNTLESVEILNAATASYDYTLVKNTFTSDGDSMVPKWSATVGRNDSSICVFENGGHMYVLDMGGNAVSTLINAIKE